MAEYPKITLTNKAMEMIAAAQIDGTILTITRVKIGDGSLADGADIKSMTDVINSMLIAPFSSSNNDGGGQITVHFAVSNSTVEAGFFAREIGVFAKLNDGEEQLYAYTNAGNKCDWIPDKHTPIDSQVIDLTLIVGNAENVTVHISDEAFALAKDLIDHNTNPKSHPHQLRPPLKRSTAYAKGDICFHDSLPSWAYLECITAGTTAENEPVFTDVNTTITDGTAVFRVITSVRKVNGNYADKNGNIDVKEYTHPNSGVQAGTYRSVTVNSQGHVTAGSNPTTLAGYGITDAATKAVATQSANGLLSAGDKKKLDGIAVGANNYSHPSSGVKAGTYTSVTVNAQGHVTAGSNPANNNTLVESRYNEDGSWYRKYSDGWLEQGGISSDLNGLKTITLLKPFKNTNYTVVFGTYSVMDKYGDYNNKMPIIQTSSKTITAFNCGYSSENHVAVMWRACGVY